MITAESQNNVMFYGRAVSLNIGEPKCTLLEGCQLIA